MDLAAIIIGIILLFFIGLMVFISDKEIGKFNEGVTFGIIITMLTSIEVLLISGIISEPYPIAMDVYQGKTTLEYKVVDGVKIDSVVIFKNDTTGLNIY